MGRTRSKPLRGLRRGEVAAELAARFIQGTTCVRELAASVGRRPSLVRRLLAEAGVRADGPQCVGTDPDDTARTVRDLYRQSGSIQAVVEATSLDRRVVRHLLALPAQSGDQLDSETVAQMARWYRAGATLQDIADETGQSYNQVRAALIEAGVPLRPPGGPARRSSAGYSTVLVAGSRVGADVIPLSGPQSVLYVDDEMLIPGDWVTNCEGRLGVFPDHRFAAQYEPVDPDDGQSNAGKERGPWWLP
jgi:helix-turn-helix protein